MMGVVMLAFQIKFHTVFSILDRGQIQPGCTIICGFPKQQFQVWKGLPTLVSNSEGNYTDENHQMHTVETTSL